ncbi:MAG TPA: hypothetical protein VLN45_05055 [Ignavibacteriaceae bacterium]|nr:hypothetical protein [Ignavibacteriaceae bacterium]
MKANRFFYITIFFCLILIAGENINAQERGKFGIRTGVYTDLSDMFLGVEYLAPIGSRVFFNPNIEYVFIENADYWTFNFDAHYDWPTYSSVYVWTGAGLGILHFNPEGRADSNTDVGLNLLFGLGFNTSSTVIPYIQGKAIISDNTDFSLGMGVRF